MCIRDSLNTFWSGAGCSMRCHCTLAAPRGPTISSPCRANEESSSPRNRSMENLSRKDNWNLEARESSEGMKREVDPKSEWGTQIRQVFTARRLAARARILLSSVLRRQSTESHAVSYTHLRAHE